MTTKPIAAPLTADATSGWRIRAYQIAWGLALCFYFLEYASRSAPAVMIEHLVTAFGTSAIGVSAILGTYYYTYSITSLLAGAALDRVGAKKAVPVGIFILAIGCLLFAIPTAGAGYAGRLLQGAGSAFAFTGAVYLAARGFSDRWLATAVGVTQLFGMLGGFAGQFAVGPLVHGSIAWESFWIYSGGALAIVDFIILVVTPGTHAPSRGSLLSVFAPYKVVLTNPQSYLCGIVGGLLFMPTNVADMIWGVPFLHLGLGVETAEAVARSSMVPLGWVIGAPLLGYLSDRIGLRKPVLIGGILLALASLLAIVYAPGLLPPYVGGLLFGIGSGAAMIPYSMIKEVNPDNVKGSATGAMNFLVFSF